MGRHLLPPIERGINLRWVERERGGGVGGEGVSKEGVGLSWKWRHLHALNGPTSSPFAWTLSTARVVHKHVRCRRRKRRGGCGDKGSPPCIKVTPGEVRSLHLPSPPLSLSSVERFNGSARILFWRRRTPSESDSYKETTERAGGCREAVCRSV
jgi:hypothetical protein